MTTITTYGIQKGILDSKGDELTAGVILDHTSIPLVDGKRLAKAGMPIVANLEDKSIKATYDNGSSTTAATILAKDYDVTAGDTPVVVYYAGSINITKAEANAGITVVAAVKTNCKRITFLG